MNEEIQYDLLEAPERRMNAWVAGTMFVLNMPLYRNVYTVLLELNLYIKYSEICPTDHKLINIRSIIHLDEQHVISVSVEVAR